MTTTAKAVAAVTCPLGKPSADPSGRDRPTKSLRMFWSSGAPISTPHQSPQRRAALAPRSLTGHFSVAAQSSSSSCLLSVVASSFLLLDFHQLHLPVAHHPDPRSVVLVLGGEAAQGAGFLRLHAVLELPGWSLDRLGHGDDRGAVHRDVGGDILVVSRVRAHRTRHPQAKLACVESREHP